MLCLLHIARAYVYVTRHTYEDYSLLAAMIDNMLCCGLESFSAFPVLISQD